MDGNKPSILRRDARVVSLVASAHGLSHFYVLALPPLFPLLRDEFGVGYAALGAIVSVLALASGVGQLPIGFVVDRFGARYVLAGGLALMSGTMVLMGLAPSYAVVPVLAVVLGLGNSVFHPSDYAILATTVAPGRVARAFSVHTFSGYVGWALAPPVMVLLTSLWSWRAALVTVGAIGLAMTAVLFTQRHLLGAAGLERRAERRRPVGLAEGVRVLLAPGILVLFAFFTVHAMTTIGLNSFAVSALVALHGLDLALANAGLTGFLVGAAVGVLVGGVVADRTRRYDVVAAVGYTAATTAIVALGLTRLSAAPIVATLGLAGFMIGTVLPSRDMIVRAMTPVGAAGKVFGFVSTGIEIGAALSPLLLGWAMDQGHPEAVFFLTGLFMLGTLGAVVAATRFLPREGTEPGADRAAPAD